MYHANFQDLTPACPLESVVKELARSQALVIQGRGSQFFLRDYLQALHVQVVAPLELRVKRVIQDLKLDEEKAKQEIARFNNSARKFVRRYFNTEVEDPIHYDLVINTGRVSFEAAASMIVDALSLKDRTVGGQSRTG